MICPRPFLGGNFKNSIVFRIVYINIAISVLFLSLVTSNIISAYSDILYEKERFAGQKAVEDFYSFVYEKYYNVFEISNQLYSTSSGIDKTLLEIYRDETFANTAAASSTINTFERSFCLHDNDIWDFIVISSSGKAYQYSSYSTEHSVLQSFSYLTYTNIQKLYYGDEKSLIFYDSSPEYTVRNSTPVISFTGKVYNLSHISEYIPIGVYIINYRYSTFQNYCDQLLKSFKGKLIIYDSNHQILFSSDPNDIGNNIDNVFKKSNEKTIVTNSAVGLSGLTVTGIVSENALYQYINDLRKPQIFIVLIAVLVSMLGATFLYRYYYPRFRVLTDTMQRSDLSIRIPIKSKDEIGLISSAYNKMCDQMQIWIDKQYSTQIQLRTAELHALTAQINPHFIYNTLESIRMQALMDGNEKVSEMLILFGSMFRWAIQSNENIVRLEDELEYISSYLQLQNIRLSNTINICINVDDRFLDCGIPKLVLQPIVENTIIHSKSPELKNTKRLSEIRITVTQSGKDLQIGISDNGPGITIEKLNAIRNSLRESSSLQYSGGIGLKNVHDRLQLIFGNSYGLTIESQESIGTRVSICIPLMSRKEMVDNV